MFNHDLAIQINNLSKSYKLYSSPLTMAVDIFGFGKIIPGWSKKFKVFKALSDINLEVKPGERIGIIGQNGAGKTTLLKMLIGNLQPDSGTINVNGDIQCLMDSGLGFNLDFTGMENIQASLKYNGLDPEAIDTAIEDIVKFVELGDYLHQPVRSYSLGMLSRLGFATATAINPEILIVDEVLGAGDAYFTAKSAERMKKLTQHGTTLLLVSHSTAQIIQFCSRTIWLKNGEIVMDGETIEVIKAYESYIRSLDELRLKKTNVFEKDSASAKIASSHPTRVVSRWNGVPGAKICDFKIMDHNSHVKFTFETGEMIQFEMQFISEVTDTLEISFVIAVYTLDGILMTLHHKTEAMNLVSSKKYTTSLIYDKNMLGNGEYIVSLALYKNLDLNDLTSAITYDLIDRSFQFSIRNLYKQDGSRFVHPNQWKIGKSCD